MLTHFFNCKRLALATAIFFFSTIVSATTNNDTTTPVYQGPYTYPNSNFFNAYEPGTEIFSSQSSTLTTYSEESAETVEPTTRQDVDIKEISKTQTVYVAKEPIPKIAERLKNQGMSQKQIIEFLKKTLPQITSELAKEKFGIEWLDNGKVSDALVKVVGNIDVLSLHIPEPFRSINNLPETVNIPMFEDAPKIDFELPYKYPSVVVCYMGKEVGYGLFAMENIKARTIIAEYTGIIGPNSHNPYDVILDEFDLYNDLVIDAKDAGNVARFAQHLPKKESIKMTTNNIALANSAVIAADFFLPNELLYKHRNILIATKDIKAFEQIGWDYGPTYKWKQTPYYFNKKGEIIK